MLRTRLIHPTILEALGEAGHGGRVLIADGNYPVSTRSNPAARRAFLNLEPGKLTVSEVLSVVAEAIPLEAAHVMRPDDGSEPSIFADFAALLPGIALTRLGRDEFYRLSLTPDTTLVIATGEQRLYANILLTIGVRQPT